MTLPEFLVRLAKKARHTGFYINDRGHIRTIAKKGWCLCPIEAVANMRRVDLAGKKLGLRDSTVTRLIRAADNAGGLHYVNQSEWARDYAPLRLRMLRAIGLQDITEAYPQEQWHPSYGRAPVP